MFYLRGVFAITEAFVLLYRRLSRLFSSEFYRHHKLMVVSRWCLQSYNTGRGFYLNEYPEAIV